MVYFLDGGEENTITKEKVLTMIRSDPVFYNDPSENTHDLARAESRRRTMEKVWMNSLIC